MSSILAKSIQIKTSELVISLDSNTNLSFGRATQNNIITTSTTNRFLKSTTDIRKIERAIT